MKHQHEQTEIEEDVEESLLPKKRLARRSSDYGLPDWVKLAITVAATTVTIILWATNNFISRTEFNQHMSQQSSDLQRVSTVQQNYAFAEKDTAKTLATIENRLTSIETKMDILVDGGTITNGNGNGNGNGRSKGAVH